MVMPYSDEMRPMESLPLKRAFRFSMKSFPVLPVHFSSLRYMGRPLTLTVPD